MKLVLINTPWETPLRKGYNYPSLGVCYIAVYLKKWLHDNVDIVVADGLLENPTEKVKREKPNVVGISSTTLEFSNAIKIAQEVKKEFSIPIIIGGVHISALPWMLPQCFDIGVVGEGEQTMLELMQLFLQHWAFPTKELKEIKGIVFHNEDKVVITEQQPFIDPK